LATEFDVICVGAGTAAEGLAAALKGSSLTLAIVESELVGGLCPYWGCIPSKALLRSAEVLAEASRAREIAASRVEVDVDFARISKRTAEMASNLDDSGAARGIAQSGATLFRGQGLLTGPRTVVVSDQSLTARRGVVIATGTQAAIPPIEGLDSVVYWTNREAVLSRELPKSLLVLGGGPIGVELAQAFARFGTDVHIVEMADRLLAGEEPEAGAALAHWLSKEGIAVSTGVAVKRADVTPHGLRLTLASGKQLEAARVLVAAGRRPRLEGLDLEAAGVRTTQRGWIDVDHATLAAADGVWAAGDITGIGAFTHLSWYHGGIIGRRLLGEDARADHRALPRVTFTDPEVAGVGLSESAAREQLGRVVATTADVASSSRGWLNGEPGGVVKLVADADRGILVGATVVSPRAGEIIAELTLAIRAEVPLPVLRDTLHAFPTFSRILDGMFPQLVADAASR